MIGMFNNFKNPGHLGCSIKAVVITKESFQAVTWYIIYEDKEKFIGFLKNYICKNSLGKVYTIC